MKARLVDKSPIKLWRNAKGNGKRFTCIFVDKSGEIGANVWNDTVDLLHFRLRVGNVYCVSKAAISVPKRHYEDVANEYELNINEGAEVAEVGFSKPMLRETLTPLRNNTVQWR